MKIHTVIVQHGDHGSPSRKNHIVGSYSTYQLANEAIDRYCQSDRIKKLIQESKIGFSIATLELDDPVLVENWTNLIIGEL